VAQTIDGFRAGKLDAFAADHALFQYSRSAKELWKFCNLTPVEIAARAILDQPELTGGSEAHPDGRSSPGTRRPFSTRASSRREPVPLGESHRRLPAHAAHDI
jgi:hypothetical protein